MSCLEINGLPFEIRAIILGFLHPHQFPIYQQVCVSFHQDILRIKEAFKMGDHLLRTYPALAPFYCLLHNKHLATLKRPYQLEDLCYRCDICKLRVNPIVNKLTKSSALHLASKFGLLDIARFLLSAQSYPDPRNASRSTPLHVACFYGFREISDLLIQSGASLSARDMWQRHPLHRASPQCTELLISYSVNLNVQDKFLRTPLHYAVINKKTKQLHQLLYAGADPSIRDNMSNAPLFYACDHGSFPYINALCESSKDIISEALYRVVKSSKWDLVQILITMGADRNIRDKQGQTLLMIACRDLLVPFHVLHLLVYQNQEFINVREERNHTALHYAAQFLPLQFVQFLIDNGSDPMALTIDNALPIDFSRKRKIPNNIIFQYFNSLNYTHQEEVFTKACL